MEINPESQVYAEFGDELDTMNLSPVVSLFTKPHSVVSKTLSTTLKAGNQTKGLLSTILKARTEFQPPSRLFFLLEILTFILGLLSLLNALAFSDCYNDYICFRNRMLFCYFCGVFFFILVLVHQKWFEMFVD